MVLSNVADHSLIVFLKSFTQVCSNCDIFVFTMAITDTQKDLYKAFGAHVQMFDPQDFPDSLKKASPAALRWILFKDFFDDMMASQHVPYEKLLFAEVGSSRFQR